MGSCALELVFIADINGSARAY
ncbi:hypothetical protein ZEAMMB73_Zm00001d004604 [Zea mays]|uniref:Uncharacterized protein n=1 Tax=Zea mays TaxID=4577 RepID=A0A1D6EGH8_MAIZE|nr:hypothetical protein ZEAMMB73_Zm00001d004604 [Zea mays]